MAKPKRKVSAAYKREAPLIQNIRNTVGARPDFLLLRISTGVFETKTGGFVRTAPKGTPDLLGYQLKRVWKAEDIDHGGHSMMPLHKEYWHYYCQAIFIEGKSKNGKLSKEQRAFRDFALKICAIHITPRTVEEVTNVLGRVPDWVYDYQDGVVLPRDDEDGWEE